MFKKESNTYTEEEIREHADEIDWYNASHCIHDFSVEFIRYFEDDWNWTVISSIIFINSDIFKNFKHKLDWEIIYSYKKLTEEELRDRLPETAIQWFLISRSQKLSIEFILEFIDLLNLEQLTSKQKLNEEILRKFCHKFKEAEWRHVSALQELSEQFMRDFIDYLHPNLISVRQKLSDEFLKDYSYRLSWYYICYNQSITEKTFNKFKDKIRWDVIAEKQQLSMKFIKDNWFVFKKIKDKLLLNKKLSPKIKKFISEKED